jgi:hypothetical protein
LFLFLFSKPPFGSWMSAIHVNVCHQLTEEQKNIMLGVPLVPAALSFFSSCFMVCQFCK